MTTPLRLLLIEASEADAASLLEEIRRGGYEPSWARVDDDPGLRAILVEEWDVALCNWHLPEISGPQAAAIVHERRPDVPVVGFSTDLRRRPTRAALKAGADDFIEAGGIERLVPVVERVLREAEARVVRPGPQGSSVVTYVPGGYPVRPGDTIYVPERWF